MTYQTDLMGTRLALQGYACRHTQSCVSANIMMYYIEELMTP
jgi:hypothetical protein